MREPDDARTPDNTRTSAPDASHTSVVECSSCDTIALVVGDDAVSCHGTPMEPVDDVDISVSTPELKAVLLQVFGLPKAGIDVCLCVVGEGPVSARDVAATLDYDRSTVTRYLNTLVDLELVDRAELNREGGGVINAYHAVDLDQMRRETLVGFLRWAGEAAGGIEEANRQKQVALAANGDRDPPAVFWEALEAE